MSTPIAQAAPGNLVPGLGAVPPGAGYAARMFPLHYVAAAAMQKLLKPFADKNAFLLVDPLRNLLVMGGNGHARLRELVLGGATRTILHTMTIPVLMAH